jgi:predicted nuclease of predicted toxin-antitoxin system
VRLLVDANLSVRVAQRLRKAGHDASHVDDHGLLEADDNAIMAFAAQESAVVVSADSTSPPCSR